MANKLPEKISSSEIWMREFRLILPRDLEDVLLKQNNYNKKTSNLFNDHIFRRRKRSGTSKVRLMRNKSETWNTFPSMTDPRNNQLLDME